MNKKKKRIGLISLCTKNQNCENNICQQRFHRRKRYLITIKNKTIQGTCFPLYKNNCQHRFQQKKPKNLTINSNDTEKKFLTAVQLLVGHDYNYKYRYIQY